MSGTRASGIDRRDALRVSLGAIVATIRPLPASGATSSAAPIVLEARPGTLRLLPRPAPETAIWGYGGQVPGPLLRVKLGQGVGVRLVNGLPRSTTITWHGVRIANAMDGVGGLTQAPVKPGGQFDYVFTPPDAGIYWYHPHVFPDGPDQVRRGCHGVLIVDELDPPKVDRDMLVVLDDWALDPRGQLEGDAADPTAGAERLGSLLTLDAKPIPASEELRPGSRVRLRLLNACPARICLVAVVGAKATVIAIDGQPSETFEPMRGTLPIGPGSRFEVLVDLPATAGATVSLVLRGEAKEPVLMTLATKGEPLPAAPPVARLPPNPRLPTRIPLERSLRREVVIAATPPGKNEPPPGNNGKYGTDAASPPWRWTINGRSSKGFDDPPLFKIARGGPVTLTIVNKSEAVQQLHVHGHVWRLLHDLDDGWDPYWRDSLLLAPGRTKHVAFIADNPGRWALCSSILDRQVRGLATWFQVT